MGDVNQFLEKYNQLLTNIDEVNSTLDNAKNINTLNVTDAILECVKSFKDMKSIDRFNLSKEEITDIDSYIPFNSLDFPNIDKAIEIILDSIDNEEKIAVYGDYDADGVTSSTILILCIRELGGLVDYYIPDRENEGYGISKSSIDTIAESDTKLIISVDCGITAVDECEYAKQKGIDMVITDHHECSDILPDACAVVDTFGRRCASA